MSVDSPSATGPFCAALGCRTAATHVGHHPDVGADRVVCDDHTADVVDAEPLGGESA